MNSDLVIAAIAFLLSGLYSGTESAMYSVHRLKIIVLLRQKARGAAMVDTYLRHPDRYLSTILVGNNFANIIFGSFMAIILANYFSFNEFVIAVVSTSIILIFAEILPKSMIRLLAERASLKLVFPLRISEIIFAPLIHMLGYAARFLTRRFSQQNEETSGRLSKDEISYLFRESRAIGLIDLQDEDIVQRVMRLSQLKLHKIMVPRTEIIALPMTATLDEIADTITHRRITRVPIYRDTIDDIVGIIVALDLFQQTASVSSLIRSVPYLSETTTALRALRELRKKNVSMAVVIDEYGGTAGIITLEDIFEEIFGEIDDEHDEAEPAVKEYDSGVYVVPGREEISDLRRELGLDLPEGEYETLAGLIIHELGRIPTQGEKLELPNCTLTVIHASPKRIHKVRVEVHEPEDTGE